MRALADEATARLAAPFVAVAPTAIWIAVSADGYFAGVAAWGIALLALAVRRTVRLPVLAAAARGPAAGLGDLPELRPGADGAARGGGADLRRASGRPCGRAWCPRCWPRWRWLARSRSPDSGGSTAITLVQQRYWQGIALNRPFQYWSWANLASVVCAIGLGSVAGIGRVFDIAAIRRRSGLHLLVLAALTAILCADLSMLSKAEMERIWLPFTIWLTAAPAPCCRRGHTDGGWRSTWSARCCSTTSS